MSKAKPGNRNIKCSNINLITLMSSDLLLVWVTDGFYIMKSITETEISRGITKLSKCINNCVHNKSVNCLKWMLYSRSCDWQFISHWNLLRHRKYITEYIFFLSSAEQQLQSHPVLTMYYPVLKALLQVKYLVSIQVLKFP